MKSSLLLPSLLMTLGATSANAALYDRGNGMIYDSTQNITWLQDANYAQTSGYTNIPGYSPDGRMNWQQASNWAASLVYGSYSDWRLPSANLNGTHKECTACPGYWNGDYDISFNNSRSEIGHLFFELGNLSDYSTDGLYQPPGNGVTNTAFVIEGTDQLVSFLNMQSNGYWESEEYTVDPNVFAWFYSTHDGVQSFTNKQYTYYAWAVRDGDVLSVNEVSVPAAAWLMGSTLISLAGIARRKKAKRKNGDRFIFLETKTARGA